MNSPTETKPEISIVIPVYNEERNLRLLWERLGPAAQNLGGAYEIIFIDDGSGDHSLEILKELRQAHPEIRILKLRRNYGQHPATIAGFEHARGKWVLTLDADLQNHPEDLSLILNKLREGHEIVSGVRVGRKDSFLRRKLPSKIVNRFIAKRTGFVQTDTGCFLKGYTLEAAREVGQYTDVGGFITATIGTLGFKYAEVPIQHQERLHGTSRYNFFAQLDQVMAIFTGYARRPFQIIEIIGFLIVCCGMLVALLALFRWLTPRSIHALLGVILSTAGLILGSVGIVGEFVLRTLRITRNYPRYLISEIIG
ncbi:MAG: glycosyltransferase family 2 protein [Verrucomicrobiae bacterium]|nr:glycosyltransferase family 2 protein [Verrucomicrobiae bacterium]